MNSNFETAFNHVLDDEQWGYAEPPQIDQPTHSGVTLIALREFLMPDAVSEDLANLTASGIVRVYRSIWDRIGAAEMPGGLDYLAFGCAVNPGITWASHEIQRVAGAMQDGIIGPKTQERLRLRAYNGGTLNMLDEMTSGRLMFYFNRSSNRYIRGLVNRAVKAHQRAVSMYAKVGRWD